MMRLRYLFLIAPFIAILFFLSNSTLSLAGGSDTGESAVDGAFKIESDGGATLHIEFHAMRSSVGTVSGETIFRDESLGSSKKKDDEALDRSQTFFFKAEFDCLVIDKNKAIMSGAITESSSRPYVGRRVLVVAQDNGGSTDLSKTDRVTWGIYRSQQRQWLASDGERTDEIGPLAWIATDSEREDDEGILSNQEEKIGCQSFPKSAFAFVSAKRGRGTVRVKP